MCAANYSMHIFCKAECRCVQVTNQNINILFIQAAYFPTYTNKIFRNYSQMHTCTHWRCYAGTHFTLCSLFVLFLNEISYSWPVLQFSYFQIVSFFVVSHCHADFHYSSLCFYHYHFECNTPTTIALTASISISFSISSHSSLLSLSLLTILPQSSLLLLPQSQTLVALGHWYSRHFYWTRITNISTLIISNTFLSEIINFADFSKYILNKLYLCTFILMWR